MAKKQKTNSWVNPDKPHIEVKYLIERDDALGYLMLRILLKDAYGPDYTFLRRMYNLLGITNEEIYEKSSDPLISSHDSNAFFADLAVLIYDKAKEDTTVISTFTDVVKSVYPSYSAIPCDRLELRDYYTIVTDNNYFLKKQKFISEAYFEDSRDLFSRKKTMVRDYMDSSLQFNSGEKVFEDPLYKKYLSRRLTELAEYCNKYYHRDDVTTENLYEVLFEGMRSHSAQLEDMMHDKQTRTLYFQVYAGITNMATRTVLRNGGPMLAYETNPMAAEHGELYHPDVEEIVNDFYREYVRIEAYKHVTSHWDTVQDRGEKISKLYLSRMCVPEPAYVLNCIQFLFNIDILNHLYEKLKKRYYLSFSWEKQNYMAASQTMQDTITELQGFLKDYQTRLDSANEKVAYYKGKAESKSVKQNNMAELSHIEASFEKQIDKKDAEINRLRRELEIKNAYIELISKPEEETVFAPVDISLIQSKRYLFVGRWQEAYPELKKTFPNSLFMDTVMKEPSPEIDAVVFLIKYMSHAMFYKIQNDSSLKEIKRVYCNNKNINTLYSDIYRAIFEN